MADTDPLLHLGEEVVVLVAKRLKKCEWQRKLKATFPNGGPLPNSCYTCHFYMFHFQTSAMGNLHNREHTWWQTVCFQNKNQHDSALLSTVLQQTCFVGVFWRCHLRRQRRINTVSSSNASAAQVLGLWQYTDLHLLRTSQIRSHVYQLSDYFSPGWTSNFGRNTFNFIEMNNKSCVWCFSKNLNSVKKL